jgi:hypothetical protein
MCLRVSYKKKFIFKITFFASLKSPEKEVGSGSGSVSQKYGSQHWIIVGFAGNSTRVANSAGEYFTTGLSMSNRYWIHFWSCKCRERLRWGEQGKSCGKWCVGKKTYTYSIIIPKLFRLRLRAKFSLTRFIIIYKQTSSCYRREVKKREVPKTGYDVKKFWNLTSCDILESQK